jgi:hypothetical protein
VVSVHKLHLVWKRDGEDVELGSCFNTTRLVVGELIPFSSENAKDRAGVWKVVLVYHQAPFMERSQTWREWRERGAEPEDMTYYWVEPAEGPWEP